MLMDYLEGVVTQDARLGIEAHVAQCSRCVAFINSYRETSRIFRDNTVTVMPAGLHEKLSAFLRNQRHSPEDN
jgi:anti-sigma factor RsiW